jgi:hypothetical protein
MVHPTSPRFRSPKRPARIGLALCATVVLAMAANPAAAGNGGFTTSRAAMLDAVRDDVAVRPIVSVGDRINGPDGHTRYESIPDGISLLPRGDGRVDLYINHETSTVPFPWAFTGNGTAKATPTVDNSQDDFDNAQVSRLSLNQQSAGVLNGEIVIDSASNYQRFCSNFLATSANGFDRSILFTNEETNDTVNRSGTAWPLFAGGSDPQQSGVVVAREIKSGATRSILGLGRMNHENAVAIPGLSQITIGTTDDTFSSNPPNSQFYVYRAASSADVWNDEGSLWAFKSNDPAIDDYYDITAAGTTVAGSFIEVPKAVAQGDQTALESWSQANGVFDFIRLEDLAYDRTQTGVVYVADTGRGSGLAPNGRIWKLALREGGSLTADLTLLLNFDTSPLGTVDVVHQPDNLETTANSLLITEDPGSGNQYALGTGTTARLWRYALAGGDAGTLEVVARVNQSQDEDPGYDVDPSTTPARAGAWESTGVVDTSAAFGPGTFLINVQAHSIWTETAPGPDYFGDPNGATPTSPDGQPDWIYKREGGQLLLLTIPGA